MSARIVFNTRILFLVLAFTTTLLGGLTGCENSRLSEQQAINKQIDAIIVRTTSRFGYTNEAAQTILSEINALGENVRAERELNGSIRVMVQGEKIPRIIPMKAN